VNLHRQVVPFPARIARDSLPFLSYNNSVTKSDPRGKLKIFLGYADGVGKTYAMLNAALMRKAAGLDVAATCVETHHQPATEVLMRDLENIPGRWQENGTAEIDADAVLRRRPHLLLVDDLAHRNPSGSRHNRRYQDVQELLEAGISVYTTMNVQNLESLNDVVQRITGVTVSETVPDGVLDEADEIEMVDLPPEELLQRLSEGRAAPPAGTFTRIAELAALRQMALRETAERVDEDMRDAMADQAIEGPWEATERVMVCLSAHPIGDRLVRAGRRLAEALHTGWFVVFVETPRHLQMRPNERARLMQHLRVAEEMGAQTVMLTGESVVDALVEFARQQNITRIVIGRPRRPRWIELLRGSRVDRILERCGGADVFVISGNAEQPTPGFSSRLRLRSPLRNYLLALGLTGLVTLAALGLQRWFEPTNLLMLFLAGVMLSAAYLGRGPSALAALVSAGVFAFVLDRQPYILAPRDARHLLTLGGLLASGLVVGTLAGWLRAQIKVARRREIQSAAINALSRDLTVALSLDEMLAAVIRHVGVTFNCSAAVLLPGIGGLALRSASQGLEIGKPDLEAAEWCFAHRQPAGNATETLPDARARCLPLETRSGPVGVLAVVPREKEQFLPPDQRELLAGFASLAALAIERAQLNEQAQQTALLKTTEKLQAALLNSISHDLRTPLSTVSGAVSSLLDAEQTGAPLGHEIRLDLLENANDEADRLNQLVGNLLDMTRLEAGAMKVRRRPCDVQDLIGTALTQASRRLDGHPVLTRIPEDLPDVPMDFVLMLQVLYNLLDNAAKYSLPEAGIEVSASLVENGLQIAVADNGMGIPPEDLERIFDKFYRVQRPGGVGGTGLGLSICRGIVEVHNGRIWASNRSEGGALITLFLPLEVEEGR
jgi:two-component system sensor histidine kinase KdpD